MKQEQTLKLLAYAFIFSSGVAVSNLFTPAVPVVDIEAINYQKRIAELELKLSKSKLTLKIFKKIDSNLLSRDKKLQAEFKRLKRKRNLVSAKRKKLEQKLEALDKGES